MKKSWVAVVVLAWGAFIGCGPKVYFKGGEALLKGEAPPEVKVPDSLRASLELTGYQGRRKTTVATTFSAIPGRKYRMDVYGFPGMVEATFHWADTGWTLIVYGREGYLRGYGDTVDLPGLGVGKVPVHDLFACLWGDFFPGDGGAAGIGGSAGADALPVEMPAGGAGGPPEDTAGSGAGGPPKDTAAVGVAGSQEDSATVEVAARGGIGGPPAVFPPRWERSEGVVRYAGEGGRWAVKVEPATGLVREAMREDSAFRIRYEDYLLQHGRPLPRRVKVFAGKRPLLEIAVKEVEDNPAWKRDPFLLRIPKGFVRLRPARGG